MNTINKRHPLDVAAIFDEYGQAFLDKYPLCPEQYKVFNAIRRCRTAAMGGHLSTCDQCNHGQIAYNSCRNRHCNKCQYIKQLQWVDKLKSNLPVCRYFHMVFTIPACLHTLFYLNQRICYKLLFRAASQTLDKVAANPTFLGAQTGAVAILHTWGQALTYHPHIHMIVPAGGLSADTMEWVKAGKKFFVPVKALSKVFRAVLWTLLEKELNLKTIRLPDNITTLAELKKQIYAKNWHVYTKKSMASPQSVVQYLGKYTHRVAISNSRLVSIEQGKVTFKWKNYRARASNQVMSLNGEEFIGRFLRHVLPSGLCKIRYYGILAAANREKKKKCIILIAKPVNVSVFVGLSPIEVLKVVTGRNSTLCPKCKKGKLLPHTILDPV